jgi:hypothetical protein
MQKAAVEEKIPPLPFFFAKKIVAREKIKSYLDRVAEHGIALAA